MAPAPADQAADAPPALTEPAAMASTASRRCPDCESPAPDAFCPRCGQEQRDRVHTSVRELAGEGVTELLDVDGRILGTLRTLVLHPGRLTSEYLAGRRTRFVRPVRLYLTLSVVYFLALSLTSGRGLDRRVQVTEAGESSRSTTAGVPREPAAGSRRYTIGEVAQALGDTATNQAVERAVKRRLLLLAAMSPEEQGRALVGGLVAHLPKAFFILVPLFAALLRLLYRRHGVYYAAHLVLALHVHAFAFLLFAVREVVGHTAVTDPLLVAWLLPYIVVALHRVYGQSWVRTTVKTALLVPAYSMLVSVALLLVLMTTLALL